jgi:hypothetical protein
MPEAPFPRRLLLGIWVNRDNEKGSGIVSGAPILSPVRYNSPGKKRNRKESRTKLRHAEAIFFWA